ncbi:hypothetical protein GCM10009859_24430 [Kocuria salsicia]
MQVPAGPASWPACSRGPRVRGVCGSVAVSETDGRGPAAVPCAPSVVPDRASRATPWSYHQLDESKGVMQQ